MNLASLLLPLCATLATTPEISPSDADVLRVAQVPRGTSSTGQLNSNNASVGNATRSNSNPYSRLARVPNMFGDSISPTGTLFFGNKKDPEISVGPNTNFSSTEVPLGGGGGRYLPIGENNRPIPTDRVFFLFNGFQNASTTFDPGLNGNVDQDLNRYTLGVEKTFQDGLSSIEIRFPLADSLQSSTPFFTSSTGNVGNLNLVLKHLIYQDEAFAVALGMGLGLPTGSDLTGTFGADSFRLTNDSVYLLPYLGGTYAQDAYFITGYMQLDVAANGDELTISTLGSQGKLNAPTFARFDLSLGYWLIQDAAYRYLDGVALVTEFHYITTLTNADLLQPNTFGPYSLGYDENRVDFLNFTTGLHFQLTELANLRVGAVFPMKTDPDRQFDGEIQVSFNRNF